MRPLPTVATAAAVEYHIYPAPAPPPPTQCGGGRSCQWQPYSNPRDFKANTALVVLFLFCTLLFGLAINIAIKRICIRRRRRIQPPEAAAAEAKGEVPVLIYSEGADCAICLSELAMGERIRVLEKCSHGFHKPCIERWLDSCSSCPICRAISR